MTRLHSAWLSGVIACALMLAGAAQAQVAGKTQQARTQETSTQNVYTQMDDRDRLLGQIWGLTNDEMIRAKVLLEGPRKSFSVENLSPIEALGIHARTDAERRKYAEMFARAFHADVERTLAWLNRNRRLAKDFEQTIASATAWLFIASIQLFARRIARI